MFACPAEPAAEPDPDCNEHVPVLLDEVLEYWITDPDGIYVDGTIGGAGHAAAALAELGAGARLIGMDRDREVLARARRRLSAYGDRVDMIHANYAQLEHALDPLLRGRISGVLLDLGVSSFQIGDAERGMSFMHDGPLDMRMDRSGGTTAADLVNGADVEQLAEWFRRYGEEREAGAVARAIVRERTSGPITRTARLAEIVCRARRRHERRIHPATRVFQALRMVVNRELEHLEAGLEGALSVLAPGGRLAVISFHSLEDRCVKHTVGAHRVRWLSLQEGGVRREGLMPPVKWITKKPVMAGDEERHANPRARSAKLRVAEREPGEEE
ncbi:16S rRNA (cytosine(1402)-N(4))-methyltransferase RsmH [Kiritimatiella glycovorans]|uniref:Ribosomal RNA small subunit methyltransferase H n=1 Tax=Kiritimatiella glycovorans TaxID=1307763 RepID=A0A0G3EF88_9BACT|nr:16S rRNA (cytosine(1402)-N(4))-methyltransferase RsmH [Kiritimatiella glycovorans]AKJ65003.1 Ribosomal RNA small subunit methyltransferase H [Kiritimatiella glycovorans]